MQRLKEKFESRFWFFSLIALIILITISFLSYTSVKNTNMLTNELIEKSLNSEVEAIYKLFEREHAMKIQQVKSHLKILNYFFYHENLIISSKEIPVLAENQITKEKQNINIPLWSLNNEKLFNGNSLVDTIKNMVGGTATIFQKIDSGYLRISTNVLDENGQRAIGTYIPNNSLVSKTIESGQTYYGRAFVVSDWYITAYEPIYNNQKIVGMLYVGNKEKELEELRKIVNQIKLGNSGLVYVIDTLGNLVINTKRQNFKDSLIYKEICLKKNGLLRRFNSKNSDEHILSFRYFAGFNLIIVADIIRNAEMKEAKSNLVKYSIWSAIISLSLLSLIIISLTYKRLKHSEKKITRTKAALEKSEKKFEAIFNNSSDPIYLLDNNGDFIEVNNVACLTMGYSRDEFLQMGLADIRKGKNRSQVVELISEILQKGELTYEVQHQPKEGKAIAVEMKSRLIDYEGQKVILCVARNIEERKALQKKIISTVIQTEEKERKRFAADLHDELGPVLSTIKLYSNLLKSRNLENEKNNDLIKDIDDLTEIAISTARDLQNRITPTVLHDFGLAMAVEEFCKYINKTKSVRISVKTDEYQPVGDDIVETILFQVCKELINNTIKHAEAQNIKIELKVLNQQIMLYYKDDGVGFDIDKMIKESQGLGLNNIMNKVKTIKGVCDFYSQPKDGMFVLITLKLKE
jgi:PAS domain S-box-containing protein